MNLPDIYSRRILNQPSPDVYTYDKIPEKLKIQISYIADEVLGGSYPASIYNNDHEFKNAKSNWEGVSNFLLREWGLPLSLLPAPSRNSPYYQEYYIGRATERVALLNYIWLENTKTEYVLDFYELILLICQDQNQNNSPLIDEFNARFREAGIGYQYENGKIIRVDNQIAHKEIIKPALAFIISDPLFRKVDEEYRQAHQHYREGHIKDSIMACGRAFESMMKAICENREWPYEKGATASKLVSLLRKEQFFRDGADKSFDCFVSMLKTGVPDLRNENAGHGKGPNVPELPSFMASYALHLTAANILFLGACWKALPAS